jgi:hypothetical protein
MRPPEDLPLDQAVRVRKLVNALEHVTHDKVLGLVMCHSDGDVFIVTRPGMEASLPKLLGEARWAAIARVAEEWQG